MDEELEDLINTIAEKDLFLWQIDNIKKSAYREEDNCWVYHEGTLYEQLFSIVSQHKITVSEHIITGSNHKLTEFDEDYDEYYEDAIKEIPDTAYHTDLLMIWLLNGDYKPERVKPAISNRRTHARKRKQRDIDRDRKRQMKRLSRWVIIPA